VTGFGAGATAAGAGVGTGAAGFIAGAVAVGTLVVESVPELAVSESVAIALFDAHAIMARQQTAVTRRVYSIAGFPQIITGFVFMVLYLSACLA
jgi:hypothetical protein